MYFEKCLAIIFILCAFLSHVRSHPVEPKLPLQPEDKRQAVTDKYFVFVEPDFTEGDFKDHFTVVQNLVELRNEELLARASASSKNPRLLRGLQTKYYNIPQGAYVIHCDRKTAEEIKLLQVFKYLRFFFFSFFLLEFHTLCLIKFIMRVDFFCKRVELFLLTLCLLFFVNKRAS